MKGAGTKEQLDELIKAANSGEDFTIISKSPEYSSSGVYRDSAIEIQFSAPVNQSTFSYEILVDGQDVSSINYLEPYFSEDGKIVRIRANSQDLINLEGHSSKDVTVKLSDKLRSQKGSILKASLLSWTFRVNKSTDDVSPIFASISLNNGANETNFTEKAFFDEKGKIAWEDSDFYTNHANKIHFSGIAFDGGSGINYLTVKETRLRDTKNDIVNDPPIVSAPIYLESDADGNAILDFDYQFNLVNEEYKDGLVKLEIQLTDMCENLSEVKTFYAVKDTFFSIDDLCVSNIPQDLYPAENASPDFYRNFYWEYETNDVWYNTGNKIYFSKPEKFIYTFEYALDFNNESTIDNYQISEQITDAEKGIKKCTVNGVNFTTDRISYLRVTAYDEGGTPASIIRRIPGKAKVLSFNEYEDEFTEGNPIYIRGIEYYIDGYSSFSSLRQIVFIANKDSSGNFRLNQGTGYHYASQDNTVNHGGSDYTPGSTLALSFVYDQKNNDSLEPERLIAGPMLFYTFESMEGITLNKPVLNTYETGMDSAESGTYYAVIDFSPENSNPDISYFVSIYYGRTGGHVEDILISPEDLAKGKTTIHLPYKTHFVDDVSYSVRIKANLKGKNAISENFGEITCDVDNRVPYIWNTDRYSISCIKYNIVKFRDSIETNTIYPDDDESHIIKYFWTPSHSNNMEAYTADKVKSSFPGRIMQLGSINQVCLPVCGLKDGNYICYVQVANNRDDPLDAESPNSLLTMGILHVATLNNKIKFSNTRQIDWNFYFDYTIEGSLDYYKTFLFYCNAEDASASTPQSIEIKELNDSDSTNGKGFRKYYLYSYNRAEGHSSGSFFTGEYWSGNGYTDEAFSAPYYVYCGNAENTWTLSNFVDNNGRCSIITDMPCFVHTLCSYYDYGTDIDEWERRGQQTQYYVTPSAQTTDTSRNYIIDTSDASGINKGDYYTVIAYFADGSILQSNVYRK